MTDQFTALADRSAEHAARSTGKLDRGTPRNRLRPPFDAWRR
jgi:hypothetical protein